MDIPGLVPPIGLTQANGGAAIVDTARLLLGINYSEESPNGSDGDGHDWMPGDPWPLELDCSGLVTVVCRRVGLFSISNGNANDQWQQRLGGLVHPSEDLKPGDIGAFLGSKNVPGYAGHTGVVVGYDRLTRQGILLSAYTTATGVCEIPMNRDQVNNGTNGLGVIGFYRPANRFPA
jgi:cell wall-associated NlpC family hydrolase